MERATLFNVPNQLTIARLVLSIVFFAFLALDWYATSLVLFLVAAGTDWIDGFWARRYGQITQLGRVLDPFADRAAAVGALGLDAHAVGNDEGRADQRLGAAPLRGDLGDGAVAALLSLADQCGDDDDGNVEEKDEEGEGGETEQRRAHEAGAGLRGHGRPFRRSAPLPGRARPGAGVRDEEGCAPV